MAIQGTDFDRSGTEKHNVSWKTLSRTHSAISRATPPSAVAGFGGRRFGFAETPFSGTPVWGGRQRLPPRGFKVTRSRQSQ